MEGEQKQLIEIDDSSNDKKYFTIVPNYILNHSTAIDQALYLQLKRLAGEGGKDICYPSLKYLTTQLHARREKIKKSIKYLIDHKWIEDKGKRKIQTKGGLQWVQLYKVNDLWQLNMDYYKGSAVAPPIDDKGCPESPKGSAKTSKGCPVIPCKEERKKNILKNNVTNFKNLSLDDERRKRAELLAKMKLELKTNGII